MSILDSLFGIPEVDQKAIAIFDKSMSGSLSFEEAKSMVSDGRATKEQIAELARGGKVPENIIEIVLGYL